MGARVSIGTISDSAYGLAVELEVVLPGVDAEVAPGPGRRRSRSLPYSNATRGNIDVTITVSDD